MIRETLIEKREKFQQCLLVGEDDGKAPGFYADVAKQFDFESIRDKNLVFIVVAHLVHTLPYMLEGLSCLGEIGALIPKESLYVESVDTAIREIYQDIIPKQEDISKEILKSNPNKVRDYLYGILEKFPNKKIMIIDHGGYFAASMNVLVEDKISSRTSGIVEHTWNGEIKYQEYLSSQSEIEIPFSISSIARGEIKALEDEHVAKSIIVSMQSNVFSGLGFNQQLERLQVGIMGYGHMGSSIARQLLAISNSPNKISICEVSPEAHDRAKNIFSEVFFAEKNTEKGLAEKNKFLRSVDVLICATDRACLDAESLRVMKPNAVIIFATSNDDLLKSNSLSTYRIRQKTRFLHELADENNKTIYMAMNSVNFSIGSTANPVLHLVFSSVFVSVLRSFSVSERKINSIHFEDDRVLRECYARHYGKIDNEVKAYNVNPLPFYFAGRKSELEKLGSILHEKKVGVISQSIEGLGGVGKTTLANYYALNAIANKNYNYIIQIDASNEEALFREFSHLARHLYIPDIEKMSPMRLINEVYNRLSHHQRMLIIFDNASKYSILQSAWIKREVVNFMPPAKAGQQVHCIITTRNYHFTADRKIELDGFDDADSRDYIKHYFTKMSDAEASRLASVLNNFPLALSQAVAYLKEHNTVTIADYVSNYKAQMSSQREYLNAHGIPESSYQATVYTTWNISLSMIAVKSNLAPVLIKVLSFYDESHIPLEAVESISDSKDRFLDAIKWLNKYALVQVVGSSLRIHRLVQTVLRLHQKEMERARHLDKALILSAAYVQNRRSNNKEITSFIGHADSIVRQHDESVMTEPATVINKILLLYYIGSTQHFNLLLSERAMSTFELAVEMYERQSTVPFRSQMGNLIPGIYIQLANSSSGAGYPGRYIKALDKLIMAPDLTVEHIVALMSGYGITPSLNDHATRMALQLFLDYRSAWANQIHLLFEMLGARQLAIVYLMFNSKLHAAKEMAERYVAAADASQRIDRRIEAYCLFAEASVFSGNFNILELIESLNKASELLKDNQDIDHYWYDQVHFMLSVLYAADGKFVESNRVLDELMGYMMKFIPGSAYDSIKKRILTLTAMLSFFEKENATVSGQLKYIYAQAYRLAARVVAALQVNDEVACLSSSDVNSDRIMIDDCFNQALKHDPTCVETFYEYGRFLYEDISTQEKSLAQFKKVTEIEIAKQQTEKLSMYQHLGWEGRRLPKYFRNSELIETEKTEPDSINYLAYCYLVMIYAKKGDHQNCISLLRLLDQQIQKQAAPREAASGNWLSPTFFAYFNTKPRIAKIRAEARSSVL